MIPMIMLCFLLAGVLVCASIAASAAFLAQRDLAGVCDGAAIAAANAVNRAALGAAPAAGHPATPPVGPPATPPARHPAGQPTRDPEGGGEAEILPLDAGSVGRVVADYQANLVAGGSPIWMSADTDGRAVTVTCRRTVRIPFGRLLGYPDGLDRSAIARARSPLD
jgi:hypothetical protein